MIVACQQKAKTKAEMTATILLISLNIELAFLPQLPALQLGNTSGVAKP